MDSEKKGFFRAVITRMGRKKIINVPAKVHKDFPAGTKVKVSATTLKEVNEQIEAVKKEGDKALAEMNRINGDTKND